MTINDDRYYLQPNELIIWDEEVGLYERLIEYSFEELRERELEELDEEKDWD